MAVKSSAAAAKKISGVYIFLGPELGKKRQAIDAIRKKNAGDAAPEETVYYAGETPVSKIVSDIQNHSLFAQSRIFIIKNAELIKKKDEIETIVSCMSCLESETILILVSDEIKLAAGLDSVVAGEYRQVFYELFEREKNEWVRSFFRQQGFAIDSEGIETILEMVENNTEALARECSRLTLFLRNPQADDSQKISAEDIEKWLSRSREESAFTLFSRIAAGDIAKALEVTRSLLAARESAKAVLAGLAWCFRKLRTYHALPEAGKQDNFELRKIGLAAPKARADYTSAARLYSPGAVDACLALTAEYDLLLLSMGSAFETVLMDMYLMKIHALGNRAG